MYGASNGVAIKRTSTPGDTMFGGKTFLKDCQKELPCFRLITIFFLKKLCKVRIITLVVTTFSRSFI